MLHDTSSDNSGDGSGVRFRVGLVVRFFLFFVFFFDLFVLHSFVCLFVFFVCLHCLRM